MNHNVLVSEKQGKYPAGARKLVTGLSASGRQLAPRPSTTGIALVYALIGQAPIRWRHAAVVVAAAAEIGRKKWRLCIPLIGAAC